MPLRFGNPTPLASRIEVLHPQAFEHARLTMKAHRSRATGEARPRAVLSPAQGVGASPGHVYQTFSVCRENGCGDFRRLAPVTVWSAAAPRSARGTKTMARPPVQQTQRSALTSPPTQFSRWQRAALRLSAGVALLVLAACSAMPVKEGPTANLFSGVEKPRDRNDMDITIHEVAVTAWGKCIEIIAPVNPVMAFLSEAGRQRLLSGARCQSQRVKITPRQRTVRDNQN